MKLFILTDVAENKNYTPEIFKTKDEAIERMKEIYDEYLDCAGDSVEESEIFNMAAEIWYTDGTYNNLEIFEVEF